MDEYIGRWITIQPPIAILRQKWLFRNEDYTDIAPILILIIIKTMP